MKTSNKILWSIMSCLFAVLLVGTIVFRVTSCSAFTVFAKHIAGNGNIITQTRVINSFNAVEIGTPGDVVVKAGKKFQIILKNDSNLLPYITTTVEGGVLQISTKDGNALSPSATPKFTVICSNIKGVAVDGSNSVNINNMNKKQFSLQISGYGTANLQGKTQALKLDISGFGKVRGDKLKADSIKVAVSGSGDVALNGKTKKLAIEISGHAKIAAAHLQADHVAVEISGVGNIVVRAAKTLVSTISGSGDIKYYGSPKVLKQDISGTGTISNLGK